MNYIQGPPSKDEWMLVDPSHRFLHLFPAKDQTKSLCGIPYVRGEFPDSFGTYLPFHGKPTKFYPERARKQPTS